MTCSSPSTTNEKQEAQRTWVILFKITELDLGKVTRLCSFHRTGVSVRWEGRAFVGGKCLYQ